LLYNFGKMSRTENHEQIDLEGWILCAKKGYQFKLKETVRFFSKWFIIRGGTLHCYSDNAVRLENKTYHPHLKRV
jgi:hypothetical protein